MATTAPYELTIDRFIKASPETVYRVWTTRTGEWFAPKPYTTPLVDIDFRAGGRSNVTMRGPDGVDMPNPGIILEVVPNRKIVFSDAFTEGWVPTGPFMVAIVTFEPEGEGTRYTATVRHWSEEAMKQHQEMGFEPGWGTVMNQLAELAEAEAA